MRKEAGLTQHQLASKLRREQSFVARIELGERRLDLVEFFWVARACRVSPDKAASELMRFFAKSAGSLPKTTPAKRKGKPKRSGRA